MSTESTSNNNHDHNDDDENEIILQTPPNVIARRNNLFDILSDIGESTTNLFDFIDGWGGEQLPNTGSGSGSGSGSATTQIDDEPPIRSPGGSIRIHYRGETIAQIQPSLRQPLPAIERQQAFGLPTSHSHSSITNLTDNLMTSINSDITTSTITDIREQREQNDLFSRMCRKRSRDDLTENSSTTNMIGTRFGDITHIIDNFGEVLVNRFRTRIDDRPEFATISAELSDKEDNCCETRIESLIDVSRDEMKIHSDIQIKIQSKFREILTNWQHIQKDISENTHKIDNIRTLIAKSKQLTIETFGDISTTSSHYFDEMNRIYTTMLEDAIREADLIAKLSHYRRLTHQLQTIQSYYNDILLSSKNTGAINLSAPICQICITHPVNRINLPCSHTICQSCSRNSGIRCPFCREKITKTSPIYF